MNKIAGFAGIFIFLSMLIFPSFVYADTPVAPAKVNTGITYDCANENGNTKYGECDFNDLILGTKKVINYAVTFALAFSVVIIAVAGFKYMISGDNASERSKANAMLKKVITGIVVIMAAWLIVTLITSQLLREDVLESVPLG